MKQHGMFSVESLFDQLRLTYDNPESIEIAVKKLNAMKQGSKSFSVFLPGVEKKMLETGGLYRDEQVKKTFLNSAIATDLTSCLVSRGERIKLPGAKTSRGYLSLEPIPPLREALLDDPSWGENRIGDTVTR